MIRHTLVSTLVVIAFCVVSSHGLELIEMNDKNQAALLVPLVRTLKVVQNAYRSGFNFESTKAVEEFLRNCRYVKAIISESSDDAYQGLAKQIKQILADPTMAAACSVSRKEIERAGLRALDNDFSVNDHSYLSDSKTEQLVMMKNAVANSASLSAAFGKLLHKRISNLSEASLKNAVETIEMYFDDRVERGFFDFEIEYKNKCKIQKIQPICKLVRRSSDNEVSAISQDVADFVQIVQANDEAKLNDYQKASGVTMDDVKTQCASMNDKRASFLRPIDKIHRWIADGLMSEEKFQDHLTVDRNLAFYNELNKLCKLVQ